MLRWMASLMTLVAAASTSVSSYVEAVLAHVNDAAAVTEPADRGTRVTQWCRIGPGRSGLSPAIEKMPDREHDIVSRRLAEHAANMQKNLDGLAELVGG